MIGLLDIDCFFVQVEQLNPPESSIQYSHSFDRDGCQLRGLPFAVSQPRQNFVIALSYEARRHGIVKHESLDSVRAKCPSIIIRPVRMELCREESDRIFSFVEAFVASNMSEHGVLIQKASIDEFYLDFPRSDAQASSRSMRSIQEALRDGLGYTSSVGIGRTKMIAKAAAYLHRPMGHFVVDETAAGSHEPGMEIVVRVYGTIQQIPYFRGKKGEQLLDNGLSTTAEVQKMTLREIEQSCKGDRELAKLVYDRVRGIDDSRVDPSLNLQKSIAIEKHFPRHAFLPIGDMQKQSISIVDSFVYRLVKERVDHCRMPQKLGARFELIAGTNEQSIRVSKSIAKVAQFQALLSKHETKLHMERDVASMLPGYAFYDRDLYDTWFQLFQSLLRERNLQHVSGILRMAIVATDFVQVNSAVNQSSSRKREISAVQADDDVQRSDQLQSSTSKSNPAALKSSGRMKTLDFYFKRGIP